MTVEIIKVEVIDDEWIKNNFPSIQKCNHLCTNLSYGYCILNENHKGKHKYNRSVRE